MANRKARAAARKSSPVIAVNAVNADQAEQTLIGTRPEPADARREQMLAEAEATIAQDDPTTPDETPAPDREIAAEAIDPTDGYDGLSDAEMQAQQNTSEPEAPAQEPAAPAPDVTADPTDSGRLLASRFPTSEEALAYAGNMKLRNYSISRQDDGQYAIEVRKASAKPAATQAAPAAPTTRATPKLRTPRAKASGPRPDTRNAVIWSMLTRPEGTTKKEVDAALLAFQPNNPQPCGIGSDAKLFSGRFGYDWKKTSDADGATRYFCFPFAAPEVESEEVVESESDQEPVVASEVEVESAAS
jgi:hypothetical protein